jgi:hypothetical protein
LAVFQDVLDNTSAEHGKGALSDSFADCRGYDCSNCFPCFMVVDGCRLGMLQQSGY